MTGRGVRSRPAAGETEELDLEEALAVAEDRHPHPGPAAAHRSPRPTDHDFDVEEALALVREPAGREPGEPGEPGESGESGESAGRPLPPEATGTPPSPTTAAPDAPQPAREQRHPHGQATPWPRARALAGRAARAVRPRTPLSVPLDAALGLVLAAPLTALTDLPSFDTSAMDGWAVAGPGPWDVRGEGILAGHADPPGLGDGEAVRIATGARVPPDATAVLRSEHGRLDDKGRLHAGREAAHGQDIRPRGQECRSGDQLLPTGTLVTPAVLGLAAAAGYDTVTVLPRPRVEILILGDELLTAGLPRDGLIRDALGPMLPSWLRALGADVTAVRRLGDDPEALHEALTTSTADLVVTTGGTASGPVDHVHPALRRLGAELLVDGVDVRPGHPMLLARIAEGRHLVGLPGNPLAAVSGLCTLAEPLLRVLAGRTAPEPYTLTVRETVHGHPEDTRLVPVAVRGEQALPLHYNGPAMLRGVAAADALAVVPPGGARPGQELELLDLPWALAGIGECFT
ncbi:MoeA domain protein domain I and II [Actinobacteria bacterium OK074]|nr:MoeA domain protein domain I and II [Actinobacteria bacterium OK074]